MMLVELARLARRHWIAMVVVCVVTGAVALDFKHTKPVYVDSGSVVFSGPGGRSHVYSGSTDDLVVMAYITAAAVNSPATALAIQRAGGVADYQFTLFNFYNQQYTLYTQPLATLQTSSNNPAVAQQTFNVVFQAIQRNLREQQSSAGTQSDGYITVSLVGGSSGPVPQIGYPKRTLAGLAFLAIVAAYLLASALDRYPKWRQKLPFARPGKSQPRDPLEALIRLGGPPNSPEHERI
jgi:hypothetical protein